MAHDLEKKWRSQDVKLVENADFSSMLLCDRVLSGLSKAGFKVPSPIQMEAIPTGRFGKDLLVQAKSGTGKTLVFVVVALEMLHRKLFRPQVLILVPTREIATQIHSVMKTVGSSFSKLTCESFIGGLSLNDDINKAHNCQIAIGTPGRIKQLISMKALSTTSVRLLVLDEADELLKYSWQNDIESIFNSLPEDKQVIGTSATYPQKLKRMIFKYLRDPYLACLDSKKLALLGIIHYAKIVESSAMPAKLYKIKLAALEPILKTIKFIQCLVYCNGINKVEALYRDIKKWGFSTTYISSKKEQTDRLKAIECLKRFKCKVLVSSDVTARGIDAENVDLVINFDISQSSETYLHRSGRAGRYGSVGATISLVDSYELKNLKIIEKQANFKSYELPDPVPVDLIQNPCLEKYAIPVSEGDESEEEIEKCGVLTKDFTGLKKNSFNNGNHITQNDNMKKRSTSSKCLSATNTSDSDEIPEDTSGRVSCSTNGTCENNNVSVKVKSQGCSVEDCKSSVKGSLKNASSYESITDCTESLEVKNETVSSCDDNLLNSKSSEVSNGPYDAGDPRSVVLNECEVSEVNNGTSDMSSALRNECKNSGVMLYDKDMNSAVLSECKNSDAILDGKYMSSSLLNEHKNLEESIVSVLENDCVEKPSDVHVKELLIKNQNADDCLMRSDLSSQCESTEVDNILFRNNLSHAVLTFIQKYETSRSVESPLSENVVILTDKNSETDIPKRKHISAHDVRDLNLRKLDYYYKVLKLFQEDNMPNNIEDKSQENLNKIDPISVENGVEGKTLSNELKEEGKVPSIHEITEKPQFTKASELVSSVEFQNNVADNLIPEIASVSDFVDNPDFFEVPDHESSPYFDKSKYKVSKLFEVKEEGKLPSIHEITEEPLFTKSSELVSSVEFQNNVANNLIPEIACVPDFVNIPDFGVPDHESSPCFDKSEYKITKLFVRLPEEESVKKSRAFFDKISSSDTDSDNSVSEPSESDIKDILDASQCLDDSESNSESCSCSHSLTSFSDKEFESLCDKRSHNGDQESTLDSSSVQSFVYNKGKKGKNFEKRIYSAAEQSNYLESKQQAYHSSYESAYQHLRYPNQEAHYSSHVNAQQQPHCCHSNAYQQLHHSNHVKVHQEPHCSHSNAYQQLLHSTCSNVRPQPHHSVNFHTHPVSPRNSRFSKKHRQPQRSMTGSDCEHRVSRKKRDSVNRKAENLPCSGQHSATCFMPSEHRCHPYHDSNFCNQRAVCDQWYQMFYNQWLHIQRCCHFT